MKKLNRKGFTLVELLAVIIILAIVVGISIPAISNIINDSKNNALGVAVDAAEKYVVDQYALSQLGSTTADVFKTTGEKTVTDTAVLKSMGFSADDVVKAIVKINDDGSACVKVTEIKEAGQYYTTAHWTSTTVAKATAQNQSKGC